MAEPTRTVYLASPIDHATESDLVYTREVAIEQMTALGWWVFNPAGGWRGGKPMNAHAVARVDTFAVLECDALLAIWPEDTVSVGVPMEIERASGRGKPIVVVSGPRIAQSVFLQELGVPVVGTVETAVAVLRAAFGPEEPDGADIAEDPSEGDVSPDDGHATVTVWVATTARDPAMVEYQRAIDDEVERAAAKFPNSDANTVDDWWRIWLEEVLEVVQARNDGSTHEHICEELIQAAAMGHRLWRAVRETPEFAVPTPGFDLPHRPGGSFPGGQFYNSGWEHP